MQKPPISDSRRPTDRPQPGGDRVEDLTRALARGAAVREPEPRPSRERNGQLVLPLAYAPASVRDRLTDAHTFPHVSNGRGVRQVPASEAWSFLDVEYARTGSSHTAVVVEVRGVDPIERAHDWRAAGLAEPSLIVATDGVRTVTVHVVWALAVPVHRYPLARPAPLRSFVRVEEFYRAALGGAVEFDGVLLHNPDREARAWCGPLGAYSLRELGEAVPGGWKRPRQPTTPAGREHGLFRWSGRHVMRPGNARRLIALGPLAADSWRRTVDARNVQCFGTQAVTYGDVARIAERTHRFMVAQWSPERFAASQAVKGAAGGVRSAEARRGRNADRDALVRELSAAGLSQAATAAAVGVSQSTVSRVVGYARSLNS